MLDFFIPHFKSTFNRALLSCSVQPPTFNLAECEREREIEREGVRVGGSTGENLAFTVRHQQYIMGGQTILLHAVFLTNDYTNKQYARILYTSKAACQALITIAPFERLTRARREIRKL